MANFEALIYTNLSSMKLPISEEFICNMYVHTYLIRLLVEEEGKEILMSS